MFFKNRQTFRNVTSRNEIQSLTINFADRDIKLESFQSLKPCKSNRPRLFSWPGSLIWFNDDWDRYFLIQFNNFDRSIFITIFKPIGNERFMKIKMFSHFYYD